MTKKQLAEMLKAMRAAKLSEQVGEVRHKDDPSVGTMPGKGGRFSPKVEPFKHTVGAVEKRTWQKSGNQARSPNSYVSEDDTQALMNKAKELGDTDTGEKSKKKTETIDVNPKMKDMAAGGVSTSKGSN
jgi:hypothetical protein